MAYVQRAFAPVVAMMSLLALAGCADGAGGTSSSGSALPGAASSNTKPPRGTADAPTVIDVNSERTRLTAGTYALAPIGPSPGPLAIVDIPEGFLNDGPFVFPQHEDGRGEHADVSRAIGYWTVTGVYTDPCLKESDAADPGPTAEDLAVALNAQRRTKATHPMPVTIGGHDGLYMEVTSPTDLDYGTCQLKTYDYWVSDPVGGFYTDQRGQVTRLWMIDVKDQRVVIAVAFGPRVPQADIQEVTDIAESARFLHP
ncbi:MAG: hypothetical protein ABIQ59_12965 [Nocardioidaceae bacterium]